MIKDGACPRRIEARAEIFKCKQPSLACTEEQHGNARMRREEHENRIDGALLQLHESPARAVG